MKSVLNLLNKNKNVIRLELAFVERKHAITKIKHFLSIKNVVEKTVTWKSYTKLLMW